MRVLVFLFGVAAWSVLGVVGAGIVIVVYIIVELLLTEGARQAMEDQDEGDN